MRLSSGSFLNDLFYIDRLLTDLDTQVVLETLFF